MNDRQWEQVKAQLPEGARIVRAYKAAENGEFRIIVKLPAEKQETRYIAHFNIDKVTIEHRP